MRIRVLFFKLDLSYFELTIDLHASLHELIIATHARINEILVEREQKTGEKNQDKFDFNTCSGTLRSFSLADLDTDLHTLFARNQGTLTPKGEQFYISLEPAERIKPNCDLSLASIARYQQQHGATRYTQAMSLEITPDVSKDDPVHENDPVLEFFPLDIVGIIRGYSPVVQYYGFHLENTPDIPKPKYPPRDYDINFLINFFNKKLLAKRLDDDTFAVSMNTKVYWPKDIKKGATPELVAEQFSYEEYAYTYYLTDRIYGLDGESYKKRKNWNEFKGSDYQIIIGYRYGYRVDSIHLRALKPPNNFIKIDLSKLYIQEERSPEELMAIILKYVFQKLFTETYQDEIPNPTKEPIIMNTYRINGGVLIETGQIKNRPVREVIIVEEPSPPVEAPFPSSPTIEAVEPDSLPLDAELAQVSVSPVTLPPETTPGTESIQPSDASKIPDQVSGPAVTQEQEETPLPAMDATSYHTTSTDQPQQSGSAPPKGQQEEKAPIEEIAPVKSWYQFSCFNNPFASGKSEQYWRDAFDQCTNTPEIKKMQTAHLSKGYSEDYTKACFLLMKYSGAKYNPESAGLKGGGSFSRFKAGRWNTNHGDAVYKALTELYEENSSHDVQHLITILATKLDKQKLKPDGDLNRILTVIGEKTGVSVDNLVTKEPTTPILPPRR